MRSVSFVRSRIRDVRAALTTIPDARTWRRCLAVYLAFLAVTLPLALASGFLRPSAPDLSPASILLICAYLFVRPAFVEELVFRGLLLPRGTNGRGTWRLVALAAAALIVFVASHPLNGWLFR